MRGRIGLLLLALGVAAGGGLAQRVLAADASRNTRTASAGGAAGTGEVKLEQVLKRLDEVADGQQQILRRLDEVMEELRIVKVRASIKR
jgi:hypothetical protein